jgi:hypothetical protein
VLVIIGKKDTSIKRLNRLILTPISIQNVMYIANVRSAIAITEEFVSYFSELQPNPDPNLVATYPRLE